MFNGSIEVSGKGELLCARVYDDDADDVDDDDDDDDLEPPGRAHSLWLTFMVVAAGRFYQLNSSWYLFTSWIGAFLWPGHSKFLELMR